MWVMTHPPPHEKEIHEGIPLRMKIQGSSRLDIQVNIATANAAIRANYPYAKGSSWSVGLGWYSIIRYSDSLQSARPTF